MPSAPPRSRSRGKLRWLILPALAVVLAVFVRFVHPFLAVSEPLNAEILVVEGWVPHYVLDAAAQHIKHRNLQYVFVSGLMFEKDDERFPEGSGAAIAAKYLIAAGVSPSVVQASPAPATNWNRTSAMARAVRDRLLELKLEPKAIDVLTMGPHARQSRLAYQRIVGSGVRVGVLSIPKDDYDPARWWASSAGIKKTTKDFAGWLKEVLFGSRS